MLYITNLYYVAADERAKVIPPMGLMREEGAWVLRRRKIFEVSSRLKKIKTNEMGGNTIALLNTRVIKSH